jgi:hypothetical protein
MVLAVTMVNRDGTLAAPTRRVIGPDPLANGQDSAIYNAMASGLFQQSSIFHHNHSCFSYNMQK